MAHRPGMRLVRGGNGSQYIVFKLMAVDCNLLAGRKQKEQPVDFTEQNLEYFKKATWKIKGDTYDKVKYF